VYGIPDAAIARQALHAWTLSLLHPVSREPLTFEAPLAADMRAIIDLHGTMPAAGQR
jgi:23S rRNA pseudouridine1911/1915/1917 synthase